MSYSLRPIVLAPLVIVLAAVLHLRRGSLKRGPIDALHSLTGLVALSGVVLVGAIPMFWPLLVLVAPAVLGLLARLLGIVRSLPTALAVYARISVGIAPLIVAAIFVVALVSGD